MPVSQGLLKQCYQNLIAQGNADILLSEMYEKIRAAQNDVIDKKKIKEFEVIHYLFFNLATHVLNEQQEAEKALNNEKVKVLQQTIESLKSRKKIEEEKRKASESKEALRRIQDFETRILAIGKEILKIKTENIEGLTPVLQSKLTLLEEEKNALRAHKESETKSMRSAAQKEGVLNSKEKEFADQIQEAQDQIEKLKSENVKTEKDELAFRRRCLKEFFSKKENLKYLESQDSQKRIPALIMLGFEKGYDEEFVRYILANTPNVKSYRYKKDLGDSEHSSEEEMASSSDGSKVSNDIERETEGETLLDYMLLQQAAGENSAKIAVAALEMGISFSHKFDKDGSPVLLKLLESRSLENGIAKEMCLYLLKQGDASLFFDLLSYQSGRVKSFSTASTAATSEAPSRKGSVAGFSTKSVDVASPSAEILAFFSSVLEESIKNGSAFYAIDPETKENLGSFLFRRKDEDKNEIKNYPIRVIWNIFQADENIQKIPASMLALQDYRGKTFLHRVAVSSESNLTRALMYIVVAEGGREKWKELISIPDDKGNLPLHKACQKGFDAGIKYFFDRDFFVKTNRQGATPLTIVIGKNFAASCTLLLRLGVFDPRLDPLGKAQEDLSKERVDRRLSVIPPEEENEYFVFMNEDYPTAIAVADKRENILRDLLRYGFDPNQKFTGFNDASEFCETSLLQLAISQKAYSAAGILVRYGAKIRSEDGNLLDFIASLDEDHQAKLIGDETYYNKGKEGILSKIRARREIASFSVDLFLETVDIISEMQKKGGDPEDIPEAMKLCDDILRLDDRNLILNSVAEIRKLSLKETLPRETFIIIDLSSVIEKKFPQILSAGALSLIRKVKTILPLLKDPEKDRTDALSTLDRILDTVQVKDIEEAQMKIACKRFISLIEEAAKNSKLTSCQAAMFQILSNISKADPKKSSMEPLTKSLDDLERMVWENGADEVMQTQPRTKSSAARAIADSPDRALARISHDEFEEKTPPASAFQSSSSSRVEKSKASSAHSLGGGDPIPIDDK